jgi:hypothetical protein
LSLEAGWMLRSATCGGIGQAGGRKKKGAGLQLGPMGERPVAIWESLGSLRLSDENRVVLRASRVIGMDDISVGRAMVGCRVSMG